MFAGTNIVVLDLETLRSARDCRHCGYPDAAHGIGSAYCPPEAESEHHDDTYAPIGWDDHVALGLSIASYWDYADGLVHWFDMHTLEATMRLFVERQPLVVGFNSKQFDLSLMGTVYRHQERMDSQYELQVLSLCEAWADLATRSYDLLDEIWRIDPDRKYERGLNSLDALCQANDLPRKEMDGATAPVLWRQGHIAEVVTYNVGDVLRTKALFELVCAGTPILRGDGKPIQLPVPHLPC